MRCVLTRFSIALAAVLFALMTLLLGLTSTAGPASAQLSVEEQELAAAEARWAASGISSYHVSYETFCYCPLIGPAMFTVVDGEVTQVSVSTDSDYQPSTGQTVESMFADIRSGLNGNYDVTATYDAVNGFPLSYNLVYVDQPGESVADANFRLKVFGLSVGSDVPMCDGRPATLLGSEGADEIQGSVFADVIVTFGGDDIVYAGDGDDVVCAGSGRDRVYGEDGDDHLSGGNDIDYVWGGSGLDTLDGNGGSDRLSGGPGRDVLRGGSGADRMWGGSGNDELLGQGGQDQMWGGDGNDTMQGNWQSDQIWGGDGDDTIGGAEGKDVIYGQAGIDTIYGGENSDVLDGGGGNDTISGGRGTDELRGGAGADSLNGGPHTDICYRGTGDTLLSCQERRWELDDTWTLVEGNLNPCERNDPLCDPVPQPITAVAGAPITIVIDGAAVSGSAGCNSYFGNLAADADFRVANIGSTEIACAADIMAVEQMYFETLASVSLYELQGQTLHLYGFGTLTFERGPA